jgi:3-oxoacyl-[acyl-carrier-protein] synthase-3
MTTATPRHAKGTGRIVSNGALRQARILGLGGYRPEKVVSNAEICEIIDSTDEWIRERSGIVTRRWAGPDETVETMARAAGAEALRHAAIDIGLIDTVIVATVSHPYQTPAVAPLVAHQLGADRAAAFDISAACAGYCHGISLAHDMVRGGTSDHVLVIGVEKLTDFTDKRDRSTAFLFADGAGAAIVGPSQDAGIGPTVWGSDGAQWDAIVQRDSWLEVRDKDLEWPAITMMGQTVFRWAVWGMAPVAQQAIDKAGITAADLDVFIPHQANLRIIDAMTKQLKLPSDVVVAHDIVDSGNTSAASIPLATLRLIEEGLAPSGGLALQIGFGAGLVYAAQVIQLP